ncbi:MULTISPECIES: MFS transporter [Photorhabdus]|uniref:MFS transporter n=1 Tax=Photorhabdus bodei TaxID=2029681 RepID=A0A329X973_9GAMM|nr:MFS transporter [Photorhabdus bodei]NDK99857.1 MFS transporter [Photorhabdus bodei]NDL04049.1 MFS transporter [Photorhabdus bodei]NDL08038.1 MFS transporter [Photorhabdus bodei]RAX13379.1 MFS transporter [Photorhabdus bodei]
MLSKTKIIIYYNVIFNSMRMLVGATSAIFLLNHGLTLVDIGLMKTIQSFIYFLFDIPSSYLADKFGRKFAIILSTTFGGVWLIITGIADSKYLFYIAEIFNSISLTILGGVFYSYLIDNSLNDNDTHKILGESNKLQFLFMAIFSIIGSLITDFDDRLVWLIAGSGCIILSVSFSWFLPKSISKNRQQNLSFLKEIKTSIAMLKDNQSYLLITSISLSSSLLYFQIILQYWQPLINYIIEELGVSIFFGIVFSAILLSQSISGWIISKNEDNNKNHLYSIVILLACSLTCIYGVYEKNHITTISTIIMFGANQVMTTSLRSNYHQIIPSELRSTFDSFISTITRLIAVIVIPLIALITENFGWIYFPILISLIISINILCYFFIKKHHKRKPKCNPKS